jgi:hypothetical protein
MGEGALDQFDFITDSQFKDVLARDYEELGRAIAGKCWKAALVLAGSIVEAVVADALISGGFKDKSTKDPLVMSLGAAIDAARSEGLLANRTAELASVVRDYRNLIHPGRGLRANERPDQDTAAVAKALVDIILREIAAKRQSRAGYTADQLVSKLEKDPGASKLIKHHTRSMHEGQISQFLLSSAPNRFFSLLERENHISDFEEIIEISAIKSALRETFRTIVKDASGNIRTQVAQKFISVLKEGSQQYIKEYARNFFNSSDLEFLDQDDREFAQDFLIAEMTSNIDELLLESVRELPVHLNIADVNNFVDPLVRKFISTKEESFKGTIRKYLSDGITSKGDALHDKVTKRISAWKESTKNNELAREFGRIIEAREIPF